MTKRDSTFAKYGFDVPSLSENLPDLVSGSEDEQAVNYEALIPLLISALDDLTKMVSSQKEEIKDLNCV